MSEEKKKLTPDRTYLCRTVILEEKDRAIHAAPPKPATDRKGKDEIDDDIIINAFSKFFDELYQDLQQVVNKRFVIMKNKDVWFDRDVAGLYPRMDKHDMPVYTCNSYNILQEFRDYNQDGYTFYMMTPGECIRTFTIGNENPFLDKEGLKHKGRATYKAFIITEDFKKKASCACTRWYNTMGGNTGENCLRNYNCKFSANLVPIYRLNGKDAHPMTFNASLLAWWKEQLVPEDLSASQEKAYTKVMENFIQLQPYIHINSTEGKRLQFDGVAYKKDKKPVALLKDILGNKPQAKPAIAPEAAAPQPIKEKVSPLELLQQSLLQCDWRRANISPYAEKQLTDTNLGHWELFEQQLEPPAQGEKLELPSNAPWVARPPQLDVRRNAICSIDFGTKSTVVVRRDGEERLLRVGKGDYTKAASPADYENPTVIELRDLVSFQQAYAARSGRPFTAWEQMTVSHQAAEAIFQSEDDSSIYYSVFSELKQWANDPQRRLVLQDRQNHLVELQPYQELAEGDFDPIETYAYYLGLYINNMHNGICLDYILSFPVNYAKAVRERLLQSFERGLRKSLPPALLRDTASMKRFRVYAGASEPAAYAVCALREFGLEPQEVGQVVSYGVFDFGGGTTDFDFGMEQIPQDHKRKFIVEQFGSGGDVYLGGEHLLDRLAYEVYLQNMTAMRQKNIPFVLPPQCSLPAGAETLVFESRSASQQAFMNRKRIARELRPLWERQQGYEKKYSTGDTAVRLFSADVQHDGDYTVEVPLKIDVKHLEACIEQRIREGVENFFTALTTAFDGKEPYPIHIFLAGNSCKAPVVQKLFEEYIAKMEKKLADHILENEGKQKDTTQAFILHLPLGMEGEGEKASERAKLYENVLGHDEEAKGEATADTQTYDQLLTGKTGVAFGLLRSRKGGKDVKIIDRNRDDGGEVLFPYYLGIEGAGNCFQVIIGQTVPYQKWIPFIPAEAEEPEFELYYTTEPKSQEGKLPLGAVSQVHCFYEADNLNEDNEDEAKVYIRKTTPRTIEYTIATAEGIEKEEYLAPVEQCELG